MCLAHCHSSTWFLLVWLILSAGNNHAIHFHIQQHVYLLSMNFCPHYNIMAFTVWKKEEKYMLRVAITRLGRGPEFSFRTQYSVRPKICLLVSPLIASGFLHFPLDLMTCSQYASGIYLLTLNLLVNRSSVSKKYTSIPRKWPIFTLFIFKGSNSSVCTEKAAKKTSDVVSA